MIAALYVQTGGVYFGLDAVDPWDAGRDARKYAGPWAVVAHPPRARWCQLAPVNKARYGLEIGDDGGCFAAALAAVRRYGGVLEHPEASHAFARHGLNRPRWRAGWEDAGDGIGKVCCVAQGNYGHRARKLTWLYGVLLEYPDLDWSIPPPSIARLDQGFHSADERRRAVRTGVCQRLSHGQRLATPPAFAELLLQMARQAQFGR